MSAKSARIETATRSPSIRLCSFVFTIASAVRGRDVRVGERGLEVGVGDERDAAGELRLCLGGDTIGDGRVVLDTGEERRGQRGDEDGARERGADRRAELCAGVLDASDLAALFVGHRRHRDGAELGGDRADPGAREQQRPGDDLRSGAVVEQDEKQHEAGEHGDEAEADDPSRVRVREHLGDSGGEEQQHQRERQQMHARCDRRETEGDRQEQRNDEEDPGLHEEQEEERGDAVAQLDVAQHLRVDQRSLRRARCAGSPTSRTGPPPRRPRARARSPARARATRERPAWPARTPTHRTSGCRSRSARGRRPKAPCRPGRAWRPSRAVCRSPAAPARGSRSRSAPR